MTSQGVLTVLLMDWVLFSTFMPRQALYLVSVLDKPLVEDILQLACNFQVIVRKKTGESTWSIRMIQNKDLNFPMFWPFTWPVPLPVSKA